MRHHNNFDAIRLFAAFLVVLGHAYVLDGFRAPQLWAIPVHSVGLFIFFALSGYLVTDSWQRDPNVLRFVTKRALRIFPGLTGAVLFTAFIIGPVYSRVPLQTYFTHSQFFDYFANIALYANDVLPAVFTANKVPNSVNGSLWTLPVEFFCYLTVIFFALLSKVRIIVLVISSLVISGSYFYLQYSRPDLNVLVYNVWLQSALLIIPFFFAGSALRLLQEKLPLRTDLAIVGFLLTIPFGVFPLSASMERATPILLVFVLTYGVVVFGTASYPGIRRAARFGDFSYGLYLYAFPIQQIIGQISAGRLSPEAMLIITLPVTLLLAVISWHFVEQPALRIKHVIQRRLAPVM